jgi:hypothetical protein
MARVRERVRPPFPAGSCSARRFAPIRAERACSWGLPGDARRI